MEPIFIKDIRVGMKNLALTFIVLEVGNPIMVKENHEVRTLKVADATACINLSLWDEPGHLLSPGDIVRITKGYTNMWRNCLTLYVGKGGDIDRIGDFCMVFNEQVNMSESNAFDSQPVGNNGSVNNGGKGGGGPLRPVLSQPPPLQQSTPNLAKNMTRFPGPSEQLTQPPQLPNSKQQNSNNKMGSKQGRGGMKMVRPDRR
ncbi:hypothetical protein AAG570_011737 [Ranatra chinensis]|uniref:SOSS complex subunit B2 n=1 Tax=Ranatra chinensis TaxID=642074 RepID=A0ABD0YIR1_9HEMI